VSANSSAIIGWLGANGGWGFGSMRIDFSINVLTATASTPFLTFTPNGNFYTPDCDDVPFPVPAGGALEGETGYACTQGGDCHLIVVDPQGQKLYEMYSADIEGSTFNGGCVAVWDLAKSYPPNLRGDGCTSADAGGFPIAAMLFTADEVYAGEIPHAIRFILPNPRIQGGGVYVHPGTHTTGATSGGTDAPPYGVRFRLRPDYPLDNLSAGAQVVARAMQKYGMFLADGGNIALTAADDTFTTHTWAEVGVDSQSLDAIQVSDMQVVDMGALVSAPNGCVRNP
jgi:serine/threonine-protein kinase